MRKYICDKEYKAAVGRWRVTEKGPRGAREGLSEKGSLEQWRDEVEKQVVQAFPGKGYSECKGPEAGMCWMCCEE